MKSENVFSEGTVIKIRLVFVKKIVFIELFRI